MDAYSLRIKVKDGELEKILNDLDEAQMTIRDAYCKLQAIGILTVEKEEAASGN